MNAAEKWALYPAEWFLDVISDRARARGEFISRSEETVTEPQGQGSAVRNPVA